MKHLKIYSIGSCNPETKSGQYQCLLEYGHHKKYLTAKKEETTTNRCIIEGFIDAVRMLKEPCNIELVSTTSIGISGLKKNKGTNINLLKQLISRLSEDNHEFEFKNEKGKGKEINSLIEKYKE